MIKTLYIRDFKSIREQTVELDPLTVLVGRSGTGKSNFVQAIRFLRNCVSGSNAIDAEGGWHRIIPAASVRPKVQIGIKFCVPSQIGEYEYRIEFSSGDLDFPRQRGDLHLDSESLLFDRKPCFSWRRERELKWVDPPPLANPINLDGNPIIGRLPALQEVVDAHTALSAGIGYYSLPNDALGSANRNERGRVGVRSGLADDASNYLSVMRDIAQDFRNPHVRMNLIAVLQRVNPTIKAINLDSLTNPSSAKVGHAFNGNVLELNLEQESDGFRRFYSHLLGIYQTPPKLTNIFEEPENGIYPGALELLAEEFKAAYDGGRGQVILTTHSPALLDHIDVKSLRVFELNDGETRIGPVAAAQREAVQEKLLSCGELLSIDPARLEEPQTAAEEAGA